MKHLSQTDLMIISNYLDIAKISVIKDCKPESDVYKLTSNLIKELQNKVYKEISEMTDHRRIPE